MRLYFKEIYRYNHEANLRFINAFTTAQAEIPEKARLLFCHILNAHTIWLSRIHHTQSPYGVWELHEISAYTSINIELNKDTFALLNDPEQDFQSMVNYKTIKGVPYSNTIQDIFIHISNHSTYHRGQVASILKEAGIQPPITDYIAFKR